MLITSSDGTTVAAREEEDLAAAKPDRSNRLRLAPPKIVLKKKDKPVFLPRNPPRKHGAPLTIAPVNPDLLVATPTHVDEGIDLSRLRSAVSNHMFASNIGNPNPPRLLGILSAKWMSDARERIETVYRYLCMYVCMCM